MAGAVAGTAVLGHRVRGEGVEQMVVVPCVIDAKRADLVALHASDLDAGISPGGAQHPHPPGRPSVGIGDTKPQQLGGRAGQLATGELRG